MLQPVRLRALTIGFRSRIIPAYNAARYIHDCLESVFNQTVGAPAHVIVVDDGSTDGTADLVRSSGRSVTVLEQRNGGAAAARNAGASVATTEWLAFLDADDRWLPAKLEKQFARVRAGGDFVYADRRNIGHPEGLPAIQSELQPIFEGDIFGRLLVENVITTSSVIVGRSLFQRVGGFSDDRRLPPAEDWDLWLRCADVGPIYLVAEPRVEYRLHATGACRNTRRMNRARQLVVERALRLHSAAALTSSELRHARAQMWATNGWDAGRGGALLRGDALLRGGCPLRATQLEPVSRSYSRLGAPLEAMARRPISIAVDGRALNREHLRGIGRYVQHLIELSANDRQVRWMVFGDEPTQDLHLSPPNNVTVTRFELKGYRWHNWEQVGLPTRAGLGRADVLFCPAITVPAWQPMPAVVTIHDTITWTSEGEDFVPGFYRDRLLPAAYRRAASVICGSQSAAGDVARMWPTLESKISVIPHGIDEHVFRARRGERLSPALEPYEVRTPYLLYVGGHIPRKRLPWAIHVWEGLNHPDVQLVVCGVDAEAHDSVRSLASSPMRDRMRLLGFVPESAMPGLYANATALLYPTLYEGFGFPAVEAQACGTPALFSARGSLAELAGPGAFLMPDDDLGAWVDRCRGLLLAAPTGADADRSRAWARRFSWQTSAAAHMEVLLRAATD